MAAKAHHPRALQMQSETCGYNKRCSSCAKEDSCVWCEAGNAVATGDCLALGDLCSSNKSVNDDSQCSDVEADVVLRNISGLLGLMLAVAIVLNVLNRCSNKRRTQKLKKSIFSLPVYVYPSRERRAAALREARSQLDVPSATTDDLEMCSSEAQEDNSATCTICLCSYEEEEVIKVLPCGHDFHAACLDSWLAMKTLCPLCKTNAFGKKGREAYRHSCGRFRAQPPSPPHDASTDVIPEVFVACGPSRRGCLDDRETPERDGVSLGRDSSLGMTELATSATERVGFASAGSTTVSPRDIQRQETKSTRGDDDLSMGLGNGEGGTGDCEGADTLSSATSRPSALDRRGHQVELPLRTPPDASGLLPVKAAARRDDGGSLSVADSDTAESDVAVLSDVTVGDAPIAITSCQPAALAADARAFNTSA